MDYLQAERYASPRQHAQPELHRANHKSRFGKGAARIEGFESTSAYSAES